MQIDAQATSSGLSLDQRQRTAPVRFGLWTRQIAATLIEQKFGVSLGVTAVGSLSGQCQGRILVCHLPGAPTAELFVRLLKSMMRGRKRAVRLIVDGLTAHKTLAVRQYIASTQGRLTMHVLPGYAPDLNPDELVWSYVKRIGVARNPLRAGEKLEIRIN